MSAEPRSGKGDKPLDRDRLVSDNLGLVYDAAAKLDRSGGLGPERGDLISAGVQGLIQAAQSFDPERGHQFSTLAVTRIRGAMLDELRRWDRTPRSLRRREREMRSAESELRLRLGRDPDPEELAEAMGVSPEEVHTLRSDLNRYHDESLDRATGGAEPGTGFTVAETTADVGPSIEDLVAHDETVEILAECLQKLPEREARVLSLYYYEELRLREIAELMGVTESRISQIRQAALKTLRTLLEADGIDS